MTTNSLNKNLNILSKVDWMFNELFDYVTDEVGDNMHEICIEVKTLDGVSVRRSWRDREKFISEMEGK